MKKLISKKHFKSLVLLMFAVVFLSFQFGTVLAENVTSESAILESGQTLNQTGFFSGNNVRVAGNVNGSAFVTGSSMDISGIIDGDLFITGQNITISGKVNGSVFTAGQDINITGEVANNIFAAGQTLNLKSQNKGSAFIAGQTITLDKDSKVARDVFATGSQLFARGLIGGNLNGSGENVSVSGVVEKNAIIEANDLYLESATINGNLEHRGENKATISTDSKVVGTTDWKKVDTQSTTTKPAKTGLAAIFNLATLTKLLVSMAGALIVWFAIKLIRPNFWNNLAEKIILNPLKSLGFGVLALIVAPTAIIILLITIVGIPLALILSCVYGIAFYISKIIGAVYIGALLHNKFNLTNKHKGVWSFLVGLIILSILGLIPIVNIIVSLFVILISFGALVLYAGNK